MTSEASGGTGDRTEGGAAEGFSGLGRIVSQVAASTGLLLALMVYFGWVRTGVLFDVFGISLGSLGLSPQDYALRSVIATIRPLVVVLLLLLLVRPVHWLVIGRVRAGGRLGRALPIVIIVLGGVVAAVGLAGFSGLIILAVEWPLVPMFLGLGVLLVAYGATLQPVVHGARPVPVTRRTGSTAFAVLQRVVLAATLVLTLFWSAATFAQLDGAEEAERIARRPTVLPGAVVFSPHRLYLDLPGVREIPLPAEEERRYRYRYDGLRLLVRSNERFFLIPVQWRPGSHAVVLPDEATYRLEFFRGP